MDNTEYSKREVDNFMKDIREQLNRIEAQTTKTNGRVSKLENWKSYSQGAIAVIVLIIVPLVIFTVENLK